MKKIKRYLSAILALTVLILSLAACGSSSTETNDTDTAAETSSEDESEEIEVRTITAVTGGSTRPYVYVDENDEVTGYDAEVLKAIFERLPQYELEWVVTDFASIFAGLTSGTYQIAVNNFSYSDERAQSYLYSYPYNEISYVFVTKNGSEHITSFADAAGKTIENGTGVSISIAIETWNEANPDLAIDLQYSDADTAVWLEHVVDGVTDFDIVDKAMYDAYVEEYGFDLQYDVLPDEDVELISSNLCAYYLFNLDDEQLRDDVSAVLKELKEEGVLLELTQEWFGDDTVPDDDAYESTPN